MDNNLDNKEIEKEKIKCGIIMPISSIDGCMPEHWVEVKSIFTEATSSISQYVFETSIVSESEDIGIIQKRIVQNIYNSDIVICDVSGKNPNVMFELGMRLAFDKPTIIVKDDKTDYMFDTGIIEHLEYPRDLRFKKIVEFKEKLSSKLVATLECSRKNTEYSPFLKSFGEFTITKLNEKEITAENAILNSIEELKYNFYKLRKETRIITDNRVIENNRVKNNLQKYPIEAIIKARNLITKSFAELETNDIVTVLENKDLYSAMIREINVDRYFPSEEDFTQFYDFIIRSFMQKV